MCRLKPIFNVDKLLKVFKGLLFCAAFIFLMPTSMLKH